MSISCHLGKYSHLSNNRGGWNKRGGGAENAKTEHIDEKIKKPIFGIWVALKKKQFYPNDMKSTKVRTNQNATS